MQVDYNIRRSSAHVSSTCLNAFTPIFQFSGDLRAVAFIYLTSLVSPQVVLVLVWFVLEAGVAGPGWADVSYGRKIVQQETDLRWTQEERQGRSSHGSHPTLNWN